MSKLGKYSISVRGKFDKLNRPASIKLKKLVRKARNTPGIGDGKWVMLIRFEEGLPVDMISLKYSTDTYFGIYAGRVVDTKNNETKSVTKSRLVAIVDYSISNSFTIDLGQLGVIQASR